jgi:hypothetical protein
MKTARRLSHSPGPGPQRKDATVDTSDSSAHDAHGPRDDHDQAHEGCEEQRRCFYCLEGWVFLGSIGPDGEELYEALRCRRCGGTGRLPRELG